jgi:hypothetical protein
VYSKDANITNLGTLSGNLEKVMSSRPVEFGGANDAILPDSSSFLAD